VAYRNDEPKSFKQISKIKWQNLTPAVDGISKKWKTAFYSMHFPELLPTQCF